MSFAFCGIPFILNNDSEEFNVDKFVQFNGHICIDQQNGTTGTDHPIGTTMMPVNNLTDAFTISQRFNFRELLSRNMNTTLDTGMNFSRFYFKARSPHQNKLIFNGGNAQTSHFENFTLSGSQGFSLNACDCIIENLEEMEGTYKNCMLSGTLKPSGNGSVFLIDCYSDTCGEFPVIDFDTKEVNIVVRRYSGFIKIKRKSTTTMLCLDLISGVVEIDSSCTGENIIIRGANEVIDPFEHATITDISQSIVDLKNVSLEQFKDIKGLLNENVVQVASYKDGNIETMRSIQYTDKTLTTIRKSWLREVVDSEGRRVKTTTKKEE